MASLSWPAWMPKSLQSGFSMQPEDRRTASSTVGTSFQRGFGGDVCIAEVSLTLDRPQAAWLEQFERDTLVQGARWFRFPLWYGGAIHWEDCRFKTRPKLASVEGLHSHFSFSLYVKGRSDLMPGCMVALLACFPPCSFIKMVAVLNAVYAKLSNVTAAKVNEALAEIYED